METMILSRLAACLLGFVLIAFGAMSVARGDTLAMGVNVVNPQWLSRADRERVLNELQQANVKLIRTPLRPAREDDDYGPAIDFIHRAFEHGIRADLIVELQYHAGAQKRPRVEDLPDMWPSYPLSDAEPAPFRAVFEPLFDNLEELGITLAALELGNEINWTAFNGDFPIPGKGKVFGFDDLIRDPEAHQIAKGYRTYLRTLSILKDIRDQSRLNRQTPILSAGLADLGPLGPRPSQKTDAVAVGASLRYLRENGMDALVDGYGVHTYPSVKVAAAERFRHLEHDLLEECRVPGQGPPCWLTEWGLPADRPCPGNDAPRAELMRELLADFQQFARQGRLKALIYFSWSDNPNNTFGIYRCGQLTESGRLALGRDTLN